MQGKKIVKHADLIAFFAGLLFLTHPIQTQGVTYIIQRAVSLTTLFYLICLSLYVKSRLMQQKRENPVVSRILYCVSLAAAVMAMFTKEMAITLPLMALFYEDCFLRTREGFNWKYAIPLLATILIIPLTMLLTGSVDFIGMRRVLEPPPGISPWQYLITQFRVTVTYLRLLLIPINQNLDYDYHIAKSLLELPALFSLILLVLILSIAVKAFSKYRLFSFGIFWFFLTLLPESNIIPIKDVIFEHRLYLPMVGFSFFMVSAVYYIFEDKPFNSVIIVLIFITSCYAVLSYRRNLIWENELTLWNDTVHKSPGKARPYNERGLAYGRQGNFIRAISDYTRAIEIKPDLAKAYNNRGIAYEKQGNFIQAISDYTRAIEIKPDLAEAYNNRGNVYYYKGDFTRAISEYTRAIAIKPDLARAYNNRGISYGKQGNFTQAISDCTRAIEINPEYARAYNNRGFAYYGMGEYEKAWLDLHKSEKLGYKVNSRLLEAIKKASGRGKR